VEDQEIKEIVEAAPEGATVISVPNGYPTGTSVQDLYTEIGALSMGKALAERQRDALGRRVVDLEAQVVAQREKLIAAGLEEV
jgi:hypothetical protein